MPSMLHSAYQAFLPWSLRASVMPVPEDEAMGTGGGGGMQLPTAATHAIERCTALCKRVASPLVNLVEQHPFAAGAVAGAVTALVTAHVMSQPNPTPTPLEHVMSQPNPTPTPLELSYQHYLKAGENCMEEQTTNTAGHTVPIYPSLQQCLYEQANDGVSGAFRDWMAGVIKPGGGGHFIRMIKHQINNPKISASEKVQVLGHLYQLLPTMPDNSPVERGMSSQVKIMIGWLKEALNIKN